MIQLFFAQRNERMSVSNPGEKIEWGADSEPRKNEWMPSSDVSTQPFIQQLQIVHGELGQYSGVPTE